MTIQLISYINPLHTNIRVLYQDGSELFSPFPPNDGPTRQALEAFLNGGGVIDAYSPPTAADPLAIPLNAVQFHAMLGILGKTEAVANAVETLPEPARSIARARINYSQQFRRNHELFTQLAALVGVTDAEIDAAWPQALAIE